MQKFSGEGDNPLPDPTSLGAYGAQAQRDTRKNPGYDLAKRSLQTKSSVQDLNTKCPVWKL